MRVIALHVPYHLDEYLPDLDLPLQAADIVRADLPSGDTWARLAVLHRRVAAVGIACSWHPGLGAAAAIGPVLESALAV